VKPKLRISQHGNTEGSFNKMQKDKTEDQKLFEKTFVDNPVETEDLVPRASVLKCSEVKTFGSHYCFDEMVV